MRQVVAARVEALLGGGAVREVVLDVSKGTFVGRVHGLRPVGAQLKIVAESPRSLLLGGAKIRAGPRLRLLDRVQARALGNVRARIGHLFHGVVVVQ